MTTYTHILELAKEAESPADGILSRTIFQDDKIKAVVFGFGQGQELSEHTAAKPAMLYFVKGEASVGLGDDVHRGLLSDPWRLPRLRPAVHGSVASPGGKTSKEMRRNEKT